MKDVYRLSWGKQRYVPSISKMVTSSDVRIIEGSPLWAMPSNCMNQFLNIGWETSLRKDMDHGNMDLGMELEQQM